MELVLAGALFFGAAALAAAWRAGVQRGREAGMARAALELHRRALLGPRCHTCGQPAPGAARGGSSRDGKARLVTEGLAFVKMHGLGNAYVFIDRLAEAGRQARAPSVTWPALARAVADPNFGVGSDGLILIEPGQRERAAMRIFNADGSEGEMCGNGIRCLAMWVHQQHGAPRRFGVETKAGVREVEVLEAPAFGRATVRVDMGRPAETGPAGTPLGKPLSLEVEGQRLEVWPVSVGNPHAVVFVESADTFPVGEVGPALERHPIFPHRINVEFLEVAGAGELRLRVWERGSGETMACGTGACAALVAAAATGRSGRRAEVQLRGGRLLVEWGEDGRIWMTGPAELVAEGVLPWHWVEGVGSR